MVGSSASSVSGSERDHSGVSGHPHGRIERASTGSSASTATSLGRQNNSHHGPRRISDESGGKKGPSTTFKVLFGIVVLLAVIFLILTIVFAIKAKKASQMTPTGGPNNPTSIPPAPKSAFNAPNRIDCHPDPGTNHNSCTSRNCLWDPNSYPSCYYDPRYGYSMSNWTQTSPGVKMGLLTKQANAASPFGAGVKSLKFMTETLPNTFHFKLTDASNHRYEVPIQMWPQTGKPLPTTKSLVSLQPVTSPKGAFNFKIIRKSTGSVLWDTTIGGLVFSNQYLQIATYFPSQNIYGFGENTHMSFKHDLSRYKAWPAFARDQAPWSGSENFMNLYGVHPFYICIENDGNAHGVFLLNSNAQEYVLGPHNSLTYRTIGGVLDFYLLPGPTPNAVIQQYWSLIGYPMMPAYWGLGFQLCRYGYKGVPDISKVVNRTKAAGIPQDVQYSDIDYMDKKKDFTYNPGLFKGFPQYVRATKAQNHLKWILILDPAINAAWPNYTAFEDGLKQNVYINWPNASLVQTSVNSMYGTTKNTQIMLGVVWPNNNTAFPDWFSVNASGWWQTEIGTFYKIVPYDGLWIDMNEPSNFGTNKKIPWYWNSKDHPNTPQLMCPTSQWDNPPYGTGAVYNWGKGAKISDKTLCMIASQQMGNTGNTYRHYDVHSLYGMMEAKPSQLGIQKATNGRGAVIGRSTYPGAGRYEGHWLGDNYATWPDMHTSIIGSLEFNIFGIPYVGADICGFHGNTTEELCLRWMQLGSFTPFSRNHNAIDSLDQDPAVWKSVAAAAKMALNFRYTYLPYLYTLFYRAHTLGESLVRSQAFENPRDQVALGIDKQFLWGSNFMITPVLTKGATNVTGYFPSGLWYTISPLNYGAVVTGPKWSTLPAPLTTLIPIHLKGGSIIPRQAPALTTTVARKNPFGLLITVNTANSASGSFYWDDGNTITPASKQFYFLNMAFKAVSNGGVNRLTITLLNKGTALSKLPTIDSVEVLGLQKNPNLSTVALNGNNLVVRGTYNSSINDLHISSKAMIDLTQLTVGTPAILTWSNL